MNDWDSMYKAAMMNPFLQAGLGVLGANKPGSSFGQALGQGVTSGLDNAVRMRMAFGQDKRSKAQDERAEKKATREEKEFAENERKRQLIKQKIDNHYNGTAPLDPNTLIALEGAYFDLGAASALVGANSRKEIQEISDAAAMARTKEQGKIRKEVAGMTAGASGSDKPTAGANLTTEERQSAFDDWIYTKGAGWPDSAIANKLQDMKQLILADADTLSKDRGWPYSYALEVTSRWHVPEIQKVYGDPDPPPGYGSGAGDEFDKTW